MLLTVGSGREMFTIGHDANSARCKAITIYFV